MKKIAAILVFAALFISCTRNYMGEKSSTPEPRDSAEKENLATAYFAAGCFWCVEADFEKLLGVVDVVSGYTGGSKENPSYEEVSEGSTKHTEAVKITYNPKVVGFDALLKYFWLNVDPQTRNRQFCDVGSQYRSAIYYVDNDQKQAINNSLAWLKKEFPHISPVTEIAPATIFYVAEDYHQDYAKKNSLPYHYYRNSCGRDNTLKEIYGPKREQILGTMKYKT